MDFGQPNVEIGHKIANGQLLFLALHEVFCKYLWILQSTKVLSLLQKFNDVQ